MVIGHAKAKKSTLQWGAFRPGGEAGTRNVGRSITAPIHRRDQLDRRERTARAHTLVVQRVYGPEREVAKARLAEHSVEKKRIRKTPVVLQGFKDVIDDTPWLVVKLTHTLGVNGLTTRMELETRTTGKSH
jgi:phage protein D